MKYTSWGAARQVTGSMHLLELESGFRLLLDCGLDYEEREGENPNIHFPFKPEDIDVLILSHAHTDHSGNIPNLVKQGFRGHIICTEPSAYLLERLWADSVNIQNKNVKRRKNAVKLFGFREIKESMDRIITLPFYRRFELSPGLNMEFYEAGHILGAASILLEIEEEGAVKRLGYSGDLGKKNSKLIVDPEIMPGLDYLLMESTYGNRLHQVKLSPKEEISQHVKEACVKKNGRLIIPAFSVGRTQAILFTLKQLFTEGELPPIRVFADSPLAMASTHIHNQFSQYLNREAKAHKEAGEELFNFSNLRYIEDEEDVEEMDMYRDSCIIVSSAGMLEGGRIQQHISDHIEDPMTTILIAGFCAPGTLGAQLLEGRSIIRIKNKEQYVYAKITQTDVFSAHPDAEGLTEYARESDKANLKKLFLIHGEEQAMLELKEQLEKISDVEVVIPLRGEKIHL